MITNQSDTSFSKYDLETINEYYALFAEQCGEYDEIILYLKENLARNIVMTECGNSLLTMAYRTLLDRKIENLEKLEIKKKKEIEEMKDIENNSECRDLLKEKILIIEEYQSKVKSEMISLIESATIIGEKFTVKLSSMKTGHEAIHYYTFTIEMYKAKYEMIKENLENLRPEEKEYLKGKKGVYDEIKQKLKNQSFDNFEMRKEILEIYKTAKDEYKKAKLSEVDKQLEEDKILIEVRGKIINLYRTAKMILEKGLKPDCGIFKNYDKSVLTFYHLYTITFVDLAESREVTNLRYKIKHTKENFQDYEKTFKSAFDINVEKDYSLKDAKNMVAKIAKEKSEAGQKDVDMYDLDDLQEEIANPIIKILKDNQLLWEKEIKEEEQRILEKKKEKEELTNIISQIQKLITEENELKTNNELKRQQQIARLKKSEKDALLLSRKIKSNMIKNAKSKSILNNNSNEIK